MTWIDWEAAGREQDAAAFAKRLIALRQKHLALRGPHFLHGIVGPDGLKDISWLAPAGREMSPEDWANSISRCVGVMLNDGIPDARPRGDSPAQQDVLLLLLNASTDTVPFKLPAFPGAKQWVAEVDTAAPNQGDAAGHACESELPLAGRSLTLLRLDRTLPAPAPQ